MASGDTSSTRDGLAFSSAFLTSSSPEASSIKVLIVLEDSQLANRCVSQLKGAGLAWTPTIIHSLQTLCDAAAVQYDLAIGSWEIASLTDKSVIEELRQHGINAPFILIAPEGAVPNAAEMLRRGVEDWLIPSQLARLPFVVMKTLESNALQAELSRSNRARHLAEDRYRFLFEQQAAGVFRAYSQGLILEVNETCASMLGYTTCEQARGRYLQDSASGKDDFQFLLRRVQERKSVSNLELEIGRPGGQTVWAMATARLLDQEAGLEPVVEGILLDITRWKRAEDGVRRAEQRFRTLLEKSPNGISLLDAEGRVLFSSHAVSPIFGYELDERVGKNAFELVHPDDASEVISTFSRIVQNPYGSAASQFRYRHKDGNWRWIEALGTNLLDDPSVSAIVVNYRDVTGRRKLQEQLFQAQKMEAVGRLAGGVAHDFNNLLTAILGYSDMVMEKLPPADGARRYVVQIKKAGERAAALTRQLLAFSRLQVMAPQVLDLNAVISDMSHMLRRMAGEDIRLNIEPTAALGRVKADPSQIEQVLLNLAVNARDAMLHGGELTIRTSNVSVPETTVEGHVQVAVGDYVLLEISDTGCGMSAETRARAFEPFFTTKEKGKGTGLGLSTVYGIIKQSGGYIWVASEPDRGSTFTIYLPAVREAVSAAKPAEALREGQRGAETLLLVEDEASVRGLLRRILRSKGYQVLEAGSGEQALTVCQDFQETIHLILTDVVMPGLTGPKFARLALALHPESQVLFMTGYAGDSVGGTQVLDPHAHFIQKPFSADALAMKVRSVLDAAPKSESSQSPVSREGITA
jgi:two-component system, cell cycle sensor histidine kinase and response regulator CckA